MVPKLPMLCVCDCVVQLYTVPALQLDPFSRQRVSIPCKQSKGTIKRPAALSPPLAGYLLPSGVQLNYTLPQACYRLGLLAETCSWPRFLNSALREG